ncbi:MAG: AMP-binding protein, partial [Chroococcidiopsidaceae cyanobacterium CP_BM_RX_35]|nr:AMP-binding protein [Chroococcidiopsidaceae cyanobacterium CP_BM_RX_35]
MNLVEFIQKLSAKNVELWVNGGKLRYRGPQDVLTPALLTEIKRYKEEIIPLLQRIETTKTYPLYPIARDGQIPLSFAQARLWFLQQVEVDNGFYNIPTARRLEGRLNIAALEYSFNHIIKRHEALRTNFIKVDEQPIQVIHSARSLTLQVYYLQQLAQTQQEIACQELVRAEVLRPFDLANDLLLRATLLKVAETEHVLLLVIHQIVADGWSSGVLLRELTAVYAAFCNKKPVVLPELPIQYADFAVWQKRWLSGEIRQNQLNYWQAQLAGAPELLQLPTDRPRPSVQSFQGTTQTFTVNPDLTQQLQALSRQSGTTLFMTLLAAFATLLYRYSGQSDILIGSPIANRHHREIESLIGFFVNTLVLRTRFEEHPSFESLLLQVRETTLQAYEHQDVPFEQVVEALQPQRSLSHSPLFQIMFVLQNAPRGEVELSGVEVSQLQQNSSIAKFDLTLSMAETARGLVGTWEYNTDLFDGSTIERMATHFHNLLSAIVENPQQAVGELPILSAAERQQLLVEWNDTEREYPKDKCIHQLFEEQVEQTPDAVAVVFEQQHLTYQQLNHRANQLAHYLHTQGVGPEVLVGICVERSLEMVVGLLGILKAGGAYVPLDPALPQESIAFRLIDAQVPILLTQKGLLKREDAQVQTVLYLDVDWELIVQESDANPKSEVIPENLAYVLYTSGSTGQPKGIAIEHRQIL